MHDFFARFAEADHNTGFGEDFSVQLFDALQQIERVEIARARANGEIKPWHGLQIMIENIRLGFDDNFQRAIFAQEVRGQNFYRRAGRHIANGVNRVGEMLRPAIIQIIAVNAGNHHMAQPQLGHGFRDIGGLRCIERQRHAGCDIAKSASAGAGFAHNHKSGVLLFPALADIRARRLFAHGDEIVFLHNGARLGISGRARRFGAYP